MNKDDKISGQFDANYLTSKGQLIALNTVKDTLPSLQCLETIDTAIKKLGNAGRHKKRVGQLWHSVRAFITKLLVTIKTQISCTYAHEGRFVNIR